MINLPHGNRCSELTVRPENWEKITELKKGAEDWYIQYRFYCPEKPKGHFFILKGMNKFKTAKGRIVATDKLISHLKYKLITEGYNPITGEYKPPIDISYEIDPRTQVCKALRAALAKLKLEPRTRQDIKNILPHVERAAALTGIEKTAIQDIRKRHIKIVLEQVGILKGDKWTPNNFNHHRKYLSILFKELAELDAIEFNPVAAISKQKTIRKIRETLTAEERIRVHKHLIKHHYRFWLFMQIFFHSGGRETELLKVRAKDVNMVSQHAKVTVIKGRNPREVNKVIKDIAVPFWKEALKNCAPDDYVFSRKLMPGLASIRSEQISRRWRTHVKEKLGITADFYSLKHSHSDEIASLLSLQDAGRHNSHTSTATTMIYAVNEKERQAERLKKVGNKFA